MCTRTRELLVPHEVQPVSPSPAQLPGLQVYVCARNESDLEARLQEWRAAGLDVRVSVLLTCRTLPFSAVLQHSRTARLLGVQGRHHRVNAVHQGLASSCKPP